jgi:hypothetical protein
VTRAPLPQFQLHLVEMIEAKKTGAGHKLYKVCRRVLTGPIVKENTYCRKVVGKKCEGEGEVNAQGEREGRGIMVFDDGDMYDGQWLAGNKHEQGKFTSSTGDVYEGGWVEDARHGRGKESSSSGDLYEGEFQKGNRHGRGKMTYASGDSYDGEWADGNRHGPGRFTGADGAVVVDHWEDGAPVGQGAKWWGKARKTARMVACMSPNSRRAGGRGEAEGPPASSSDDEAAATA